MMRTRALRLRRESWGFAIGSSLFAVGALPGYANGVGVRFDNATYFVGSLFFTAAAFIQLALSGRRPPRHGAHRVERCDWYSAAIQFVGTLLFNVSTGVALVHSLTVEEADRWVWRPDMYGSIAFLVSSALAVVATTETDRLWDPRARNWLSTWLNMAGSVAFGVSAVAAFVNPSTGDLRNAGVANLGTLVGALCFLVAALLTRPPRDPAG
jgi:drug/metabolite transporter (DMT)-like permease